MAVAIDRRAVGRGIVAYLAVAVPCGLVLWLGGPSQAGHESNLWVVAALALVLVAPLLAGAVAGGAEPSPLVHGALAVAVPAGAFLIVRVIVGVGQGTLTATQAVNFLLFLVVFTSLGMLGGYLGFRRRQRLA
jgi:hypothetical protein